MMGMEHDAFDGAEVPEPEEWLLGSLRNAAWLEAQVFPSLAWAVPGIIPEGMGLFTGAPKVGKSWVSLDIALAVARGGVAFGQIKVGQPRPVLLLAMEDSDRRLQDRISQLLESATPFPSTLDYATAMDPTHVQPTIGAWLGRHGHQQALVILDTLGKVMEAPRMGEGAYAHDYRVASAYKALVVAHPGATLLIVHHVRKQKHDGDWMNSTSGTNGLNGAADWTLNLSAERNEPTGFLRVTGRDVIEGEYAIRRAKAGNWALEGNSLAEAESAAMQVKAAQGLGDQQTAVLTEVSKHPEGVGPTEVANVLGIPANYAGTYLKRLADQGRITRVSRGKYAPHTPVETVESVETDSDEEPDPDRRFNTFNSFNTRTEGLALVGGRLRGKCPECLHYICTCARTETSG